MMEENLHLIAAPMEKITGTLLTSPAPKAKFPLPKRGMLKKEVKVLLAAERKAGRAKQTKKSEIQKLLVEERKKMRASYKESRFKQKTLNIYKNQVVRAAELGVSGPDYTLEEFREFVRNGLEGVCFYCSCNLTLNSFSPDHMTPVSRGGSFNRSNLVIGCKPCNFQKGKLGADEFKMLQSLLLQLDAEAARDVRTRLTTGGKWMQR